MEGIDMKQTFYIQATLTVIIQREVVVGNLEEALDFVDQNKGVAEIPFCGSEECAQSIEIRVDGLQFLGVPDRYLEDINESIKLESGIYCAHCQKPVDKYWRIGRSY